MKHPISKAQLLWAVFFLGPNPLPLWLCGLSWCVSAVYWAMAARSTLAIKRGEGPAHILHVLPTTLALLVIFYSHYFSYLGATVYKTAALAWLGILVTLAGHLFCVWARIHIGKYWSGTVAIKHDHKIVDTGPYAFVRHPIYTGVLVATLGSALAAGTALAFVCVFVMILTYLPKWKREEDIMLEEFGQSYADYMKRTKTIIPYVY